MEGKAILRVRMAERSKALRSGRSPLLWAWSFFEVKNFMQGKAILRVRMAEWSKVLQSGPSPLAWAWETLYHVSGWPSDLRRCVPVVVHLSGRGLKTKCKVKSLSHVRMAERSKALRLDHIPHLWAWSFFEVKNYMQGKAILRVRMAEQSKALRLDHIPLLWAWDDQAVKGAAFMSKSTRFGSGFANPTSDNETLNHVSGWPSDLSSCVPVVVHLCGRGMAKRSKALRSCRSPPGFSVVLIIKMKGNPLPRVRMAERSKALRSGRSPLVWAWDGQAVKGAAIMSKSTRFWRGLRFLSGLKRCVQVSVKFCRRGFGFDI
ncbi:hypothetical protein TNCV_4327251 [Trichonephila clavipes]|nr:hypothetical protein TNCV_4327251 [Trichonephila clavipes]